ncbi:hypothetical protein [Streptacidiphilus sp. PAMC 29251]
MSPPGAVSRSRAWTVSLVEGSSASQSSMPRPGPFPLDWAITTTGVLTAVAPTRSTVAWNTA